MKFFRFLTSLTLVIGMFCMAACSDDDESVSNGNGNNGGDESSSGTEEPTDGITLYPDTPDTISLTAEEGAVATVRMRCYCGWTTIVECYDSEGSSTSAWFTVSPSSGTGGSDWPTLTLTANHNSGDVRTGMLYLIPESGDEVGLKVEQEDGFLSVSVSGISGTLVGGKESSSSFSLSYRNASAGDVFSVDVELGGASDGLSVEAYSTTLSAGSGTVEIPISGTPTSAGTLTAAVSAKVNGEELSYVNLTATVYVLYQAFENFNWGGDYVGMQKGMNPTSDGSQASKDNAPEGGWTGLEPGITEVSSTQIGTNRMFDHNSYTDTFLENLGLSGWNGSCNFMFHHQMQIGHDSEAAWLITPELTALTGSTKIRIEIDMCLHHSSAGGQTTIIGFYANDDDSLQGSGNFDNNKDYWTVSDTLPTHDSPVEGLGWVPITWEVEADPSDRIMIWHIAGGKVVIANFRILVVEE